MFDHGPIRPGPVGHRNRVVEKSANPVSTLWVVTDVGPVRRKSMHAQARQAGQLSVRLFSLAMCVTAVFLLIGGAASADAPPPPTVEYVVGQGDTLWGIASRYTATGDDVRVTVAQIVETNSLSDSGLVPGQVLRVPES